MKLVAYGLFLIGCGAAFASGDSLSAAAPASPSAAPTWEWGQFSLLGGLFDAHPKIDIMVVTELTNVGRAVPEASLAHPVYFSGADGGLTSLGDGMGGERPPNPADLASLMTKSLRSGGYLPATAGHPPTVYIFYSWGSFNGLRGVQRGFQRYRNLIERAALVGGTQFARDWDDALDTYTFDRFANRSAETSYLVSLAGANLYYLVATACDYRAAVDGKVVILWQTRLSSEARVVSMAESLPQMVASAGPSIGHETNGPMRLNRPAIMEGDVEIGRPYVVADGTESNAPNPFPPTKRFLPPGALPAEN